MTNQELKKLKRVDLLELLIQQCEENESLKQKLVHAERELENHRIHLEEAGSIAEAALRMNNIFEAAQKAADQYLENIQEEHKLQLENCLKMKEECEQKCSQKTEEMEQYCCRLEQETREKCSRMIADARKQSQTYVEEASKQVNAFLDTYSGLRNILEMPFGRDVGK